MSQEDLNGIEADMEQRLRSLSPRPAESSRDRLMYEAGRRKERRRLWGWQSTAGGLAAVLAMSLLIRPEPREVVRVVTVKEQRPQTPTTSLALYAPEAGDVQDLPRPAYLMMRQAVLNGGIEALPAEQQNRSGAAREAPTMLDLHQRMRGESARDGGRL